VWAHEHRISKKYLKGRENWKEICVYEMITLKCILKKIVLILHLNFPLKPRGKAGFLTRYSSMLHKKEK